MIRILFLAANPAATSPLQLGEECREIQEKLRSSDERAKFELRSAWATRPDDILQQMNEFKPHILHFSGHGSKDGEIISYCRIRPERRSHYLLSRFGRCLITSLSG